MIAIIDYGMGNVGSIANMLRKIGAENRIVSRPDDLAGATQIILPGVGSFDQGVKNLEELSFQNALREQVESRKVPILGICLGMQLLGRSSEEGSLSGFGWIPADAIRFTFPEGQPKRKVPHMTWNDVEFDSGCPLFQDWQGEARFYFVHSYHMVCDDRSNVAASTNYGIPVTAAVAEGNVYGVQFHPEKSHRFGMSLLRNFVTHCK